MNPPPIIALLTDFGLLDAYVGTMKGVMLAICPAARLVDLTHAVDPQNIRQAAYLLLTAVHYFPPQTVFVAVVDPGVGTQREAIAAATDYGRFVGPNNGVFSFVVAQVAVRHAVVLQNRDYLLQGELSTTFHGRDVFAPAAAHLALARRRSRVGVYDLREWLESTRTPLPVDAFAALAIVGDRSCLEPIVSRYAASRDEWSKTRLADMFRAIVKREAISRRHAAIKRLERRQKRALDELWPR
jgi:hypothetical protein